MATTARPQDLYDELRTSHEIQRTLCTSLTRARTPDARRDTLRELDVELAAHAAAEERFLYAPMLMDDAGKMKGASRRYIRTGVASHDGRIEVLSGLRPGEQVVLPPKEVESGATGTDGGSSQPK